MVFDDSDILSIETKLRDAIQNNNGIVTIGAVGGPTQNLRDGSLAEIKSKMYSYIVNDPAQNVYRQRLEDIDKFYKPSAPTTPHPSQKEADAYDSRTERYERIRDVAKKELSTIIEKFSNERIKRIIDAEEKYTLLAGSSGITIPEEQWMENATNDIASKYDIKEFLENSYAEELTKDHLNRSYNALTATPVGGGTPILTTYKERGLALRNILFPIPDQDFKKITDALNYVDATAIKTGALTKIRTEATTKNNELTKLKDDYKTAKEELKKYTTPVTDLNRSWLNVIRTYGKKLVNGRALSDAEKKNRDYKKLANTYVALKIDDAYNTPDYIQNEIAAYDALMALTSISDKKDALKKITSLKEDIESVSEGILETLNEELKDAYKNVIMGSSLDDPNNNTGEFDWFMFKDEKTIVDNHDVGTYAQAGLGFFQETFLESPALLTALNNLEKRIVDKHKKRSSWLYGGFFKRKNHRIGVDEALRLGLGYAIKKSHSVNIETEVNYSWRDIRALGPASTLEEILDTYREASKLGEELNDDARSWTERENEGYVDLDNAVNAASGYIFEKIDEISDRFHSIWAALVGKDKDSTKRIEELKKSEFTETYNVDDTAIKPNSHPHAKALAFSILAPFLLYHLGKTVYDIMTKPEKAESPKVETIENILLTGLGAVLGKAI